MPSGASPRETRRSAARTFSAWAMRLLTCSQTPSVSSAALLYFPAGTASVLANARWPCPRSEASGNPGLISTCRLVPFGAMSTRRLERRSDRVSGLMSLRSARYSIQSRSAEMKMSAGAPCSICLASAELAAYETTARLPVRPCHWALISSRAVLRLAAAKTRTLPLCASGALPNVETTSKNRAAHSVNAFALRQREVEDLGAKSDTTPSNTCSIADLAANIIQYHHVVFWLKLAHSTKVDTGFIIRIHASYR